MLLSSATCLISWRNEEVSLLCDISIRCCDSNISSVVNSLPLPLVFPKSVFVPCTSLTSVGVRTPVKGRIAGRGVPDLGVKAWCSVCVCVGKEDVDREAEDAAGVAPPTDVGCLGVMVSSGTGVPAAAAAEASAARSAASRSGDLDRSRSPKRVNAGFFCGGSAGILYRYEQEKQ